MKRRTKIVEEIPHQEWIKIFNKYIGRLEKCVVVDGENIEHLIK